MSDNQTPEFLGGEAEQPDPVTVAAKYMVEGGWVTKSGGPFFERPEDQSAFYGGLEIALEKANHHGYSKQLLEQAKIEAELRIIDAEIEKQEKRENSRRHKMTHSLGHWATFWRRRTT